MVTVGPMAQPALPAAVKHDMAKARCDPAWSVTPIDALG
jgi:hypothetical protein